MYRSGKKATIRIVNKVNPRPGIDRTFDAGAQATIRQKTPGYKGDYYRVADVRNS